MQIWDRDYVKLSFCLILSLSLFYIIKTLVDAYAFIISSAGSVAGGIVLLLKDALSTVSPLIAALIVSYLLDPIVTFIISKRKNMSRAAAVAVIYALMAAVLVVGVVFLIKSGGASGFFPGRIDELGTQISDMFILIRLNLAEWNMDFAVIYLDRLADSFSLQRSGYEIAERLTVAARLFTDLLIGFAAAFYFLVNKEKLMAGMVKNLKLLLKERVCTKLFVALSDIHQVLTGYIRGQAVDGLIIAVLIGAGLKLMGVEFAFAIGVITGFTNLIPYLGALVGFVLAVVMAFITGPPVLVLYAALYVLIIQQIDSMVIIPKILGTKVDLSPVAVILAVVMGGRMAGFLGMVFAVPAAAMVKIWFGRFTETLAIKQAKKYNKA